MLFTPAVCPNDIKFVQNDTEVEDVGVKKSTLGDKLVTARTRAFNGGDLEAV